MLFCASISRRATKLAAAAFLRVLIKTVPYRIHTILTDHGVQFVQRDQGGTLGWIGHIFGRVCAQNGIEDRITVTGVPLPPCGSEAWRRFSLARTGWRMRTRPDARSVGDG